MGHAGATAPLPPLGGWSQLGRSGCRFRLAVSSRSAESSYQLDIRQPKMEPTGASPWILQLVPGELRRLAFRHRSQVRGERHALWGNGYLKLSIQLACTLRGHDEHMNISCCKPTRPRSIGASYICTSLLVLEGPTILSEVETG